MSNVEVTIPHNGLSVSFVFVTMCFTSQGNGNFKVIQKIQQWTCELFVWQFSSVIIQLGNCISVQLVHFLRMETFRTACTSFKINELFYSWLLNTETLTLDAIIPTRLPLLVSRLLVVQRQFSHKSWIRRQRFQDLLQIQIPCLTEVWPRTKNIIIIISAHPGGIQWITSDAL